jgi:hypothetical protein
VGQSLRTAGIPGCQCGSEQPLKLLPVVKKQAQQAQVKLRAPERASPSGSHMDAG